MLNDIHFNIVKSLPVEDVISLYQAAGWWKESKRSRETLPLLIENSFCFIAAMHQEKLIGMGRVISDGVSDGYIQDVIIHHDYRGQSIGKEIVRQLALFCVEQQLEWIALIAEPDTASFYENLGFEILENYTPMRYDSTKSEVL